MTELNLGLTLGVMAQSAMPTSAILLISIALLNLAIGISVYRRNPVAALNRSFACTALAVGLWTAALAWGRLQPSSFGIAIRAAFSAGSFVPLGVLYFVENFGPSGQPRLLRLRLLTLISVFFSVLSFSPWMVPAVT